MSKFLLYLTFFSLSFTSVKAQDINALLPKTRQKIESVNDYEAAGKMKTNVAFLKVPVADVNIYFKKPNQLKLKSSKGVSFVPKGAVSFNINNIISTNFTVLDAGNDKVNNVDVRVAKLLPNDDNNDIVLATLYIDPVNFVVLKSKTTTKENGTYELEMKYGKFIGFGLPDKILFSFNTKDYKLPKGVTFDFDIGNENAVAAVKNKKGVAEIVLSSYIINKGISDAVFK
ncbi:MAG: hypothetical protein FGM46_09030 [Ferruginibacter sp.]|nr:hypothetical protein [Ferruginibacter sp.]